MSAFLAQSRTVISSDVVGSSAGDRRRQLYLDHAHEAVLDHAFAEVRDARYPIARAFRRADGDSTTIVVDADVARAWLVADFVLRELVLALAHVNDRADAQHRLRLRVAVAHGEIVLDPPHIGGDAVVRAARLRDAPAVRAAMAEHPGAALAVIVSDALHHDVVVPGERGLDRVPFTPVDVAVKDFAERGWLHLPAVGTARAPVAPPSPPPFSPPSSAVTNTFQAPVDARYANFGVAK